MEKELKLVEKQQIDSRIIVKILKASQQATASFNLQNSPTNTTNNHLPAKSHSPSPLSANNLSYLRVVCDGLVNNLLTALYPKT
jgi:hypothetical protein